MQCERITLAGDPAALASELRSLVPATESVGGVVAEIIARVRAGGDDAVRFYTRQFDTGGTQPAAVEIPEPELETAAARLPTEIRDALQQEADHVRRVAEAALGSEQAVGFDGHTVTLREVPVGSAAVYVPGGRSPYPSTVVMGVVTARAAGVERVSVCSPPSSNGDIDPVVLAACQLAGASAVFRMGGAQAIAALAYGTQTVSAVDVIVGPGNLYVQEAKRQVSAQVGIDGFAGPSDLMVLAGADADPAALALDLLAQAEHGAGTLVVGVSPAAELLDAVAEQIEAEEDWGAVARLVQVSDAAQALALAEAFAPEHLELVGEELEELAGSVTRAGCLLVGSASATAFGDYIAGSNHILPTGGTARFASALSPANFRRRFAEVRVGEGASALARAAAPLARAEGFELHARSMEARIRDNGER